MTKSAISLLAFILCAASTSAQSISLAQGTYATHFTNFKGLNQAAEVGQLVLTPTSPTGGIATWDSNGMWTNPSGNGICIGQFTGTYVETDGLHVFLFQDGGTCASVICKGQHDKANCVQEIPEPVDHRGWYYCLDEGRFIDCLQAGAYGTTPQYNNGWQRPAEQERWDKVSQ